MGTCSTRLPSARRHGSRNTQSDIRATKGNRAVKTYGCLTTFVGPHRFGRLGARWRAGVVHDGGETAAGTTVPVDRSFGHARRVIEVRRAPSGTQARVSAWTCPVGRCRRARRSRRRTLTSRATAVRPVDVRRRRARLTRWSWMTTVPSDHWTTENFRYRPAVASVTLQVIRCAASVLAEAAGRRDAST